MQNVNLKKDKWTTISGFIILSVAVIAFFIQFLFEVKTPVPLWSLGLVALSGVWLIYSPDSFFTRVNKSVDKKEGN